MKKYLVIIEEPAREDIRNSYDWGCINWGEENAVAWAELLWEDINNQLLVMPKRFPLAPENDEFVEEIRHMIFGRYRIIFTIRSGNVHVLHIRGAYVSDNE